MRSKPLTYHGGRFFVVNDSEGALKILADAGCRLPSIPKGFNTHRETFHTAEGQLAAVIQQIGFEERETDLGREVNGVSVVVCSDGQTVHDLDQFVDILVQ